MILIWYFILGVFGFLVPGVIAVCFIYFFISSFRGGPFVVTSSKQIDAILQAANLKANQLFIEIGSGDGRIVRTAVKQYGVMGVGLEINPLLNMYARYLSHHQRLNTITFITQDLFTYSLSQANVVFVYIAPEFMEKVAHKLEKELKRNTLVITHGFEFKNWHTKLHRTQKGPGFTTYYYVI